MQPLFKEAIGISVAGSIGGLLGTTASLALKQPFPAGHLAAFLTAPILGAAAALIGVYLLANSDRRDLVRCLVFAMVCGIVWKPVFDAGSAIVTQRANVITAERKVDEVGAAAAELKNLAASTSTLETKTKVEEKINDAAALATSSWTSAKASDNLEVKASAARSFDDLVKSGNLLREKSLLTPEANRKLLEIEAAARAANK